MTRIPVPVRRRIAMTLAAVIFLTWLVGQVLRDRFLITALCFYLPSPLAVIVLAGLSMLAWKQGARRWAALVGMLAVGPAIFTGAIENHWSGQQQGLATIRLVHWNVGSGAWGWDGVCQHLKAAGGQIYVLSEVPDDIRLDALQAELGADWARLRLGNLAVFAQGRLDAETRPTASGHAKVQAVRWQSPQGEL